MAPQTITIPDSYASCVIRVILNIKY